jgi:hypothetical protein
LIASAAAIMVAAEVVSGVQIPQPSLPAKAGNPVTTAVCEGQCLNRDVTEYWITRFRGR